MSFKIIDIFPLGATWRIEDVGQCQTEQINGCEAVGGVQTLSTERARGGMPYRWQKGPAWANVPRVYGSCTTEEVQASEARGTVIRREVKGTAEVEDFIGTVTAHGFVSGGDEEAMQVVDILMNL
jgi:hypothetical protein